jgi:hypothetical protein
VIGFGRYAGWPDINECTGGDCNAHLALSAVPGPTTNAKAMIAPDMGEEQPVATKQPGVGTGKTSGAFVRTPASSRQTAVPR